MNRRTFSAQVSAQTGHPASTADAVLEAAIAVLAGELVQTGRFEWRGLGTFTVRSYAARQIHNPATGQLVTLPQRRSITFKPSGRLRTKIKGTTSRRSR